MQPVNAYLSPEAIGLLHEKTYEILKTVGVRFDHPQALETFKKNGAKVDDNIVFIDRQMLNDALASVPQRFDLTSKGKQIRIEPETIRHVSVAELVYTTDADNQVKQATNADAVNFMKLMATSDVADITYGVSFVDRRSFSYNERVFGGMAFSLKYSPMPQVARICYSDSTDRSRDQRLMFDIVRRFEGCENGYHATTVISPTSPLTYDAENAEKIIINSEQNQPIVTGSFAMACMTSPPSVAGTIAVSNAEILAGIVLSQLLRPGLPAIYGAVSTGSDLRNLQPATGAPETALMVQAFAALAHSYGLLVRTGGSLSDAKQINFQSGSESMMLLNTAYSSGVNYMIHAFGKLASLNILSPQKYVLDEENAMLLKRFHKGIDMGDNKLDLDLIRRVGPSGNYLGEATPADLRQEFYHPQLYERNSVNAWIEGGKPTTMIRANEVVKQRLDDFTPAVITSEQAKLLDPYIPAEYREINCLGE